jgi:hypothetical protein
VRDDCHYGREQGAGAKHLALCDWPVEGGPPMIIDDNTEQITLSNRVIIEIATASFRTSRGYSFAAVLADEVAFWRSDESSANPDVEISACAFETDGRLLKVG